MARIKFPKSRGAALRIYHSTKVPKLKYRKSIKGESIPLGSRLTRHGLTPEENLARYAPEGTTPERMVFGWLKRHNFTFTFQEPFMGGRLPGGAVLDFVVYDKVPPIVIRIQSYWHESAEAKWHDAIQLGALLEHGFIVEDIWEREINTVARVDQKMREIMFGAPKFGGTQVLGDQSVCPYCGQPDCVRCR